MLDIGILVLRLVIGLYVAAHGAQKLFGWFGGPGLRKTTGLMSDRMGFRPALVWVTVLAGSELIGGLLMAMGGAEATRPSDLR
jgi:putative oxidoreductase